MEDTKTPKDKLNDQIATSLVKTVKTSVIKVAPEPEEPNDFFKAIFNEIGSEKGKSIHRLAFDTNPTGPTNSWAGLYKQRTYLLPPWVIKKILIKDDLVASILQARQNQISVFGRPRPDRFSFGFVIEPNQSALEAIENIKDANEKVNAKTQLRERIDRASKIFLNCGHTDSWHDRDKLTLSQYLSRTVRNALGVGMLATEIIWRDLPGGKKQFHSFRVIDAGTIYRAAPYSKAAITLRENALQRLEQVKNEKLQPNKWQNEEYSWIQVINDQPVQAFTPQECLVHMFYQVPDVETDGYPVTPLDTVISAVTTHINITTYNKVYFQNGRASKGFIVIESDDVTEAVLQNIKQNFMSNINNASNCIDGSVRVFTQDGYLPVSKILGNREEKNIKIWTGKKYEDGVLFKTGKKKLTQTKLANGLITKTSPDHRFMVAEGPSGPIWKRQEELKVGDFVCIAHPLEGDYGSTFPLDRIVDIQRFDEEVDMYDISVFDNEHAFVGDGFVLHNSFRMPVFSVAPGDKINWFPMETQQRDAEFQYLTDQNARIIMSAFMISPDEIPGWGYLSKGTASQSLAETNNQYKIEASRDVGIRPLIAQFEDFFNSSLFPLVDEDLAKICKIRFMGLDSDTAEKETVRLQQDMQVHMSMDEILEKVEKRAIGRKFGGEFLFNQPYQQILDKYFTVGQIKAAFFDDPGALNDPSLQYFRDAFWMQNQQLLQAKQQMEMQSQMAQQQAQVQQQQGGEVGYNEGGRPEGSTGQQSDEGQKAQQSELEQKILDATKDLNKSDNFTADDKSLNQHQKTLLDSIISGFEQDTKNANDEILKIFEKFKPKK